MYLDFPVLEDDDQVTENGREQVKKKKKKRHEHKRVNQYSINCAPIFLYNPFQSHEIALAVGTIKIFRIYINRTFYLLFIKKKKKTFLILCRPNTKMISM